MKGGLAGSAVLNAKTPMMLERNFAPGFRIDLHVKDLGNALETGHAVGAPLPLTAAVMEMMQTLRARRPAAETTTARWWDFMRRSPERRSLRGASP